MSEVFGWSRIFHPTTTRKSFQLNHFLHRTPTLRILTRAYWNFSISFETFVETETSCCVPRFALITSGYKIVGSKTSFTFKNSGKFWKGQSRTFYLRLRNPVKGSLLVCQLRSKLKNACPWPICIYLSTLYFFDMVVCCWRFITTMVL